MRHKTVYVLGLGLIFTLPVAAGLFFDSFSSAIAAAPSDTSLALSQIRIFENRFFFHSYEQDPAEKRLQRLELLVFGRTQPGGNQERLQRLSTTIAERDRESALKTRKQAERPAVVPAPFETAAKPAQSKQHYPALNALEWRALKKTYPNDGLDDRLARLETKLFGQPSPAMSYADRVDRLNRTLGVGVASATPGSRSYGPMPKTRPGNGIDEVPHFSLSPFSQDSPFFGNGGFYFGFSSPGNPPDGQPSDPNQKQLSELFQQMNKQMEEMMRMTNGLSPFFQEQPFDELPIPNPIRKNPANIKPAPIWKIPFNDHSGTAQKQPPPYNDPNSI